MAIVNNATGVYNTLGYNYSDPNGLVVNYSANTLAHMNTVPPVITTWQAQDIANGQVGGYLQNPVSGFVHNMSNTANSIISYSPILSLDTPTQTLFANITANAHFLSLFDETYSQNALTFLFHTDRLSGVRQQTDDAAVHIDGTNLPYYKTAISTGKAVSYIVYQTDGIANTSASLGSFTSLLSKQQIGDYSLKLANSANTIANSLTVITNMDDTSSYRSNLSYSTVLQISQDFANVVSLMSERETADKQFYYNSSNLVNNYNTTKQFTNMGQSEGFLVNNFIGTDKLKARVNS
jgi:hypothetical protein